MGLKAGEISPEVKVAVLNIGSFGKITPCYQNTEFMEDCVLAMALKGSIEKLPSFKKFLSVALY